MRVLFKSLAEKFTSTPTAEALEDNTLLLNVGAGFDIPTGRWVKGQKGENILIGGFGVITGIMGRANTYKSTIMHHFAFAGGRIVAESGHKPYIQTYDAELTVQRHRMVTLSERFEIFKVNNIETENIWQLTDATGQLGDVWWKKLRDWLSGVKLKDQKKYMIDTPFLDKEGKPVKALLPTISELDSISAFKTSDIEEMEDKHGIADSGGNTYYMRGGLRKSRLFNDMIGPLNKSNHFTLISAHVGDKFEMNAGPGQRPTKDMQYMKSSDAVKSTPDGFKFLPTLVYQTTHVKPLTNQTDRLSEYPRTSSDKELTNIDLNVIRLTNIRSKVGSTGWDLNVVASQFEGVDPTLTEYCLLKDYGGDGFGITRSGAWNFLHLRPNVKFTRRSLRETYADDFRLKRAINITSEILQMHTFMPLLREWGNFTMVDLYNKIAEKYDWDILLDSREYYTFDQYGHPIPYLSSLDIIEMFEGTYHPYWYDDAVKAKAKLEAKAA